MKYRKLLLLPLSRLPDIVGSPTTRRIRMSDLKSAESEISSDRCTYLASRTYLVLNIPQLDFLQLVEIKRSLITHLQDLPAMSRLNVVPCKSRLFPIRKYFSGGQYPS